MKEQSGARMQIQERLQPMEDEARTNPGNFRNVLQLGDIFKQMQETNAAIQLFQQSTAVAAEKTLSNSSENTENLTALAQIYAEIGNLPKVESVLERVVELNPNRPETHYDLAALKTLFGKNAEAFQQLKIAIDASNARLKTNPAALNLLNSARNDPRFGSIRSTAEFQKIVPPQ
jgi:tetratricopeptide (TPR) repeat protein